MTRPGKISTAHVESNPRSFALVADALTTRPTRRCSVDNCRDRSGWGFTVKQGGRTVHEDSGAHRVTTSSLTMEVEVVTHAIQWLASQRDSQITYAIILTDSMNFLEKVEPVMGCPD